MMKGMVNGRTERQQRIVAQVGNRHQPEHFPSLFDSFFPHPHILFNSVFCFVIYVLVVLSLSI